MNPAKILVMGGVTYDELVYLETLPPPIPNTVFSHRYHETVGGTGAGKALNLNRLFQTVTFHALIGDDWRGRAVRDVFAAEKLNFVAEIDPKGTERHINLMETSGGRVSIYVTYATFEPTIDRACVTDLIASHELVVLNIINYCRFAIPTIKAKGKPIWCDIHDYDGKSAYHQDFVDATDYLFLSSDKLPDYGAFMQAQIGQAKRLVVCTHGKKGATALTADGQWFEVPALDYPQVDTNGAGDSFFAGVLYGYMGGQPIEKCLRFGTIVAGLTVTSPDLFSPMLSPEKLQAEYAERYG